MFRFFEKPEIIIVDNDHDNSLDIMFFNDRTDIKIINNKNYTQESFKYRS